MSAILFDDPSVLFDDPSVLFDAATAAATTGGGGYYPVRPPYYILGIGELREGSGRILLRRLAARAGGEVIPGPAGRAVLRLRASAGSGRLVGGVARARSPVRSAPVVAFLAGDEAGRVVTARGTAGLRGVVLAATGTARRPGRAAVRSGMWLARASGSTVRAASGRPAVGGPRVCAAGAAVVGSKGTAVIRLRPDGSAEVERSALARQRLEEDSLLLGV